MRLDAWWPKTAGPACPGTATTHIRTCAGTNVMRKSREPSRRCFTIAVMQKTNHEELSLAFLSISKINIFLSVYYWTNERVLPKSVIKKNGNILKPYTIIFIYKVYLRAFTRKRKCVPNIPDTASAYDNNSPSGFSDSIPSRSLNPFSCNSLHKWRTWADT